MNVIKKEDYKVPVFSWCPDIEENAMAQIDNLARLPFVFNRVAVMGDCHSGYGMPIGGVIATDGVVIPNAVGVDIGCGMCAIKTNIQKWETAEIKKIMQIIRDTVPVGFNHHKEKQQPYHSFASSPFLAAETEGRVIPKELEASKYQLGTLGGGNHFIELQKDEQGYLWVMIHSGSRNLGYQVANFYNNLAVELGNKWHTQVPSEHQLDFLPLDSQEGKDYMLEMNYCIDFAFRSRELMIKRCIDAIRFVMKPVDVEIMEVEGSFLTNIAHNYASMENHFGKNVLVHRKGATLAREGTIGIIPGSQGTSSYIVKGKGNKDSFESCSHGAGRKMSRAQAENELNLEEEKAKLDKQGIIHGIRTAKDLDEASGAYKDIDVVMENQKDLVDILYKLTPVAVIKG